MVAGEARSDYAILAALAERARTLSWNAPQFVKHPCIEIERGRHPVVEARLAENSDREMSTTDIGELLMQELRGIDHVAFVRFASVYRDFQDVEQFLTELNVLVRQKRGV